MKRNNKTLLQFLTAVLLVMVLDTCDMYDDGGGDQIHPPQTRIIDVLVQPDTVAPQDTATFTCIIEDSLDERFKFSWLIDEGEVLGTEFIGGDYSEYVSDSNNVKWIAPGGRGRYQFTVFVNNGSKDSLAVQDGFSIVVE